MVVLLEESVVLPVASTVIDDGCRPTSGPDPVGHAVRTVGFRHNCGASPTTINCAVAEATLPEVTLNSTENAGLSPLAAGLKSERSSGVPAEIGTCCQPAIGFPSASFTVNFAVKFEEDTGLVRLNDFQALIPFTSPVQAIRGTSTFPEKVAMVGATDEQPRTLSTMLYVTRLGCSWRVTHMQLSMTGSGVTV